ncbi:MAG: TonB-dependent receptor [Calditrichaceae bacterium]|nr:TonB-dependent receptor [Calditrichaceae bacterium]
MNKSKNVAKAFLLFAMAVLFINPVFSQETEELVTMSLEDLLNMEVVTVSKSSEKISDAPGVISVITKEEMQMFGGTTLKDILERVPGLIGSTVYMTDRSTIAPRGDQVLASSSHVLLLLNGRPMRESLEGGIKSETYESFPVNVIEKIEVIRGPGSVLYGSNAFSAVINVITEEAQRTGVTVTGVGGQESAYGALGKVTVKSGDFSLVAAGREFKKADWETNVVYPDTSSPVNYNTIQNMTIPNNGRGIFLGMNYNNFSFMSSYNYWKHSYFVTDFIQTYPAYGNAEWAKTFANLGYNLTVNDQWEMDFNVTYNRSTFEVTHWPGSSRDSYEIVGEWTNFYNPMEELSIVFGGLYNYFKGEEEIKGLAKITDGKRYSVGAYAQLDYRLIEELKLIGGFQANKVEELDLNVVPRVGAIWYPMERINVKALYSQAFRAPSINELYIDFSDMHGNKDLVPEEVSTIDFGVNYHGEQAHAGLNYFYSKMENIIYQDRSGTEPTYMNGTDVTFQGVEFEGKYYFTRNLLVTGSVTYQQSEDKSGNEHVTPIADMGAKFGIGYTSDNGLTASIFNVYQGALDDKYKSQYNPSPEAYNLLNIYCKYNLNNLINVSALHELSVFVQADNVLDKEIWLPDWGLLPGKTIPVNQGRAVYAGINIGL